MKIINFGSLNIDNVHQVAEFVQPGQTIFAQNFQVFPGGKGLNQSIAAARAGARVLHAGCIGSDGQFLLDLLTEAGADASLILRESVPSGHAMIEINSAGQNRIIVYGGTNQMLTEEYIDRVLEESRPDDIVLLQNETNLIAYILTRAREKGLKVAFNPSPMPQAPEQLPLDAVSYFMVNEIEAAQLAGMAENADFEAILQKLSEKYPQAAIIMTLGGEGVLYAHRDCRLQHPIFQVPVQDTTAAGDTFSGYFLAALCRGADPAQALKEASAASAIAVSRMGAASSIPMAEEVQAFLEKH